MQLARFEADLHTHTVASGHAFGTILENAKLAAQKGLKLIAITDHGPAFPEGPRPYYFLNMRVLPDYIEGVRVLHGIEANIMDDKGTLDLDTKIMSHLDIVLAGFHHIEVGPGAASPEARAYYGRGLLHAVENPMVDILVHPGNPAFPVDPEEVVAAATRAGKAIEINNSSFVSRPKSTEACREFARLCASMGTWISIGSDAHSPFNVGEFENAWELTMEAGVKESQIINLSMDNLKAFFEARGKVLRL